MMYPFRTLAMCSLCLAAGSVAGEDISAPETYSDPLGQWDSNSGTLWIVATSGKVGTFDADDARIYRLPQLDPAPGAAAPTPSAR